MVDRDPFGVCQFASLPVCQFASLPVRLFARSVIIVLKQDLRMRVSNPTLVSLFLRHVKDVVSLHGTKVCGLTLMAGTWRELASTVNWCLQSLWDSGAPRFQRSIIRNRSLEKQCFAQQKAHRWTMGFGIFNKRVSKRWLSHASRNWLHAKQSGRWSLLIDQQWLIRLDRGHIASDVAG